MSDGPFLNALLLCSKVVVENKQLRIEGIQNWTRDVQLGQKGDLVLFVAIYGGALRGPTPFRIRLETPSGQESWHPFKHDFGDSPVVSNLVGFQAISIPITISETGVYWFEVLHEEKLLGRAPWRVSLPGEP